MDKEKVRELVQAVRELEGLLTADFNCLEAWDKEINNLLRVTDEIDRELKGG